ncbi:MAG: DUF11 domain-containing protein [Phycisphaeraceae bacterium]|nr:DUF11 domain-containing protein [Phycisphaeraceae bacterium]
MKTRHRSIMTVGLACAALAAAAAGTGCTSVQKEESRPAAQAAPREEAPRRAGVGAEYRPQVPRGHNVAALAFPTGEIQSSALMIHQVIPAQVRRTVPYTYELHVTNLTHGTLQNVLLTTSSLQNAEVTESQPAANRGSDGSLQWFIGDLGAQKTEVIRVSAKADKVGTSSNCVSVSYNNALCVAAQVVEPGLTIVKSATPEVLVCDPITLRYEVRNPGTGAAESVRVRDQLPAGLTTVEGNRSLVEAEVGTLGAGESRVITVQAKAARTGTFQSPATAVAAGNLTAEAPRAGTVVRQPVLTIECASPEQMFLGREGSFEVTVKNTGDGDSADTVVAMPVPANARFVRASAGGEVAAGRITWRVGRLRPNEARSVSASFASDAAAVIRYTATAEGVCAALVSTACQTAFVGIPALLLDGTDEPDPVQVGETVTYILHVTNQGTAPLTNVRLVCTMDELTLMEYVTSTGPTAAAVSARTVRFEPIARLEPKERRTYRIVVRAKGDGQVQFRGEASSNEITRPLVKVETTNFYR